VRFLSPKTFVSDKFFSVRLKKPQDETVEVSEKDSKPGFHLGITSGWSPRHNNHIRRIFSEGQVDSVLWRQFGANHHQLIQRHLLISTHIPGSTANARRERDIEIPQPTDAVGGRWGLPTSSFHQQTYCLQSQGRVINNFVL